MQCATGEHVDLSLKQDDMRHLKQDDKREKENVAMADKPADIIDRTLVLIHVLLVRSGKVGLWWKL